MFWSSLLIKSSVIIDIKLIEIVSDAMAILRQVYRTVFELNFWDRRGIQGCVRPICCSMWPMGSLSCSFRSKTQRRDSLRKWHHFWYLWAESLTLPPDSSWRDSPALPVKDDVFFCLYLLLWTRCPFSFFHFFLTFCFCQSGLCCLGFPLVRNVNALYFELFFFASF